MYLATPAPQVVHTLRAMLGAKARRLTIVTIVGPYLAIVHFTPVAYHNNTR